MHATCGDLLNFWLTTCKEILALSYNSEIVRNTAYAEESKLSTNTSLAITSGTSNTVGASSPVDDGSKETDSVNV